MDGIGVSTIQRIKVSLQVNQMKRWKKIQSLGFMYQSVEIFIDLYCRHSGIMYGTQHTQLMADTELEAHGFSLVKFLTTVLHECRFFFDKAFNFKFVGINLRVQKTAQQKLHCS